jgi:UDP-glucose 4-epimerase
MKILITGGAGFIGSHLSDHLIKLNHQVFIIDNLLTGNINYINPNSEFFKIDINNFNKIEQIIKKIKPDLLFHFAAQISVKKSIKSPLEDMKTNVLSSVNLIETAFKNNIKKIIFASTGGVMYGDDNPRPSGEDLKEKPESPYAISKNTIDNYLQYKFTHQKQKFCSLRFANVYGPRQNDKSEAGVVAIFLNQMLNQINPVINNTGNQTRDFIYIDDIVRACIKTIQKPNISGVFNLGTGVETNINKIFNLINKNFNNKFQKKYQKLKSLEQEKSSIDSNKFKKYFNWEPQIKLEDGIKKTFNWFKDNQN